MSCLKNQTYPWCYSFQMIGKLHKTEITVQEMDLRVAERVIHYSGDNGIELFHVNCRGHDDRLHIPFLLSPLYFYVTDIERLQGPSG